MSTTVTVTKLPKCDFCNEVAEYDGRTVMGPWANMCTLHFGQYGTGLGTGRGQKLVVKKQQDKAGFEQWMKRVDRIVQGQVGLSCHDLPDVCYHDWRQDGMSAAEAASQVISESMAEMGFDW